MPSLEEILKKTKAKSEQATIIRKPVDIAVEDRPYSSLSITEVKPQPIIIPSFPPPPLQSKKPQSKLGEIEPCLPLPATTALVSNAKEIDNKPITNWQQASNKLRKKLATNRQQSDNKVTTKSQQLVNKPEIKKGNWQQTGNATGNKTGNKVVTNRQQTDNKLATKTMFSELVGLQRDIVLFICHECKNSRSRITEALTLEHIATPLKRSTGAVKTTIQRLEKKGCVARVEFKNGRGGWSRYEVTDQIYHDALRSETGNKLATNWQQTGNKLASQLATEPATSSSSSSSSLKDLKTTTELGDEWNFDISPYARFGFTVTQLKQLASLGVISALDVEQSLIEFSYDLENNSLPKIIGTKTGFLMGILRKGQSYVSEGFKNEQDATIEEMAKRAETKRKNLLKAKFEAWEANLGDEEIKQIETKLPTHLIVLYRTYGVSNAEVRNWLFDYFMQNVKGQ